jgi:hypothetical protein
VAPCALDGGSTQRPHSTPDSDRPVPVPAQLREDIKQAYARSDALLEEERFAQATEARQVLEPLHQDMCMVFGPDDEMTAEIAEALAVIRLGLDGPAS